MTRQKIFLLSVLLFFLSQITLAQDSIQRFSLKEAQDFAIKNSPSVRSSQIDISIAKKKIWETTAIGLPQVKATVNYQQMLDIPTQMMPDFISPAMLGTMLTDGLFPSGLNKQMAAAMLQKANENPRTFPVQFGTKHNASWDITVSQLIFNGAYIIGLQASRTFAEFSEQALKKSETDVKHSVTKAYYLVLIAKENKRVLDSSYAVIDKISKEIEQMNKQGFVEITDLEQMKINAANVQNARFMMERQIEVAEKLLKFQMGIELEKQIELTESLNDVIAQGNLEPLTANGLDLKSNIDYQIMETQEKLNYLNFQRERTTLLPSVVAFGTYKKSGMSNEFGQLFDNKWYPTTVIGISLEIPIFSSWQKRSRIQQAKLEVEKVKIMKERIAEGLNLDLEQSKNEYSSALDKYNTFKENLVLAEKIYKRSLTKYKEGVGSSLELTQTQSQFLSTQGNYFAALLELLNAKIKIDKLLNR